MHDTLWVEGGSSLTLLLAPKRCSKFMTSWSSPRQKGDYLGRWIGSGRAEC